jgi:uncharacterized protein YndB with AHSA1/START domain
MNARLKNPNSALSRFIKAPPALVWKAWSTPEHLAKWWIPAPDRVQGDQTGSPPGVCGFETSMREGGGEFQPHVEGCFLEIVPEARLIFTTVLSGGWKPAEPWLALTAIITFEAEGNGTRYCGPCPAQETLPTPASMKKWDSRKVGERRSISLPVLSNN